MADEPDIGLMEELEYEGLGGDEEQGQISGYVQGLAQEVSQQLESWMEDGALTDSMLEPMIELLKQVFVDFEHYYVQSLQVDQLTEEKETLQQSLHTMKQKYQSAVEVCVYVCMHVCVCVYVCVCVCVYVNVCVCVYVHVYCVLHMHVYMRVSYTQAFASHEHCS